MSNRTIIRERFALFWKMFKLFTPYRYYLIAGFIASLLVGAMTGLTAYLVKPALDQVFLDKNEKLLLIIPLALIGATLLKGIGRYLQNYCMTFCGARVIEDLRTMLYDKLIHLPIAYHEEQTTGDTMSRILNDVGTMRSSIPSAIMIFRQCFTILSLVIAVIIQNPSLAIYSILTVPLALYPLIAFSKRIRKYSERGLQGSSIITNHLQETFAGIRVVKAFSTEAQEKALFTKTNEELIKLSLKQAKVSEITSPFMELIGSIGAAITIFIGGYQVIQGGMTPGEFFAFLVAVMMMYDPIKSITTYNMILQSAFVSAQRIYALLESPMAVETGGTTSFPKNVTSIAFHNVTKQYPGTDAPALSHLSFSIHKGERVALVGPSGAGKTTIANLLPRFYLPTSGDITINDIPIEHYELKSLRDNIAIVSQNAFLFNRSIADNIAYGHSSYQMEDVERAARSAYAHEFIMELPDGYNTYVGEAGCKLSGGQRQRITIARAVYKNSPILILDEATSALDSESELAIQHALDNLMLGKTSLVIAHRLSTILSSDRIFVMDKGTIIAIGTHEKLLATCELYKKLYTIQFNDTSTQHLCNLGMPQCV